MAQNQLKSSVRTHVGIYQFWKLVPKKKLFCELVGDKIQLKTTHNYYCQVQGVMAITKVDWCDFIVWTNKSMNVQRIEFDPVFWDICYTRLQSVQYTSK